MEKVIISCLESRVETNRSIYARFLLGPFKDDNAITIATALRRSLLSKVKGIAITAIHIQGVTHEFSTIVGVRESVLDLALNFQQIVLRKKTNGQTKVFEQSEHEHKTGLKRQNVESGSSKVKGWVKRRRQDKIWFGLDDFNDIQNETVQIGYLQMQGPAVVYANDLKLPAGIECVDPAQHIATLSTEGLLVVKFLIGKKRASFDSNSALNGKKVNVGALAPSSQQGVYLSRGSSNQKAQQNKQSEALDTQALLQNEGYTQQSPALFARANKPFTKSLGGKKTLIKNPIYNTPTNSSQVSAQLTVPFQSQFHPLANSFKSFDPTICLRNTIFLDPIFDSVLQANYIIEKDDLFNQPRERIVLEFWTNGSVHPRQALHKASLSLISTFSIFRKVFHLDSL